jgi:hypothetical protein
MGEGAINVETVANSHDIRRQPSLLPAPRGEGLGMRGFQGLVQSFGRSAWAKPSPINPNPVPKINTAIPG